ncbi:Protein N-acetyltransferase, RimJ/RimL family [Marininema mesophilum]|uniref:Protein N-acetyltransferase, RimJ/RimL family n=1 Tax=Marininema mesophilum TaxID=1048340 RepID=A0A1H2W738_9BACL|nr:GNAT family protein [Marininema mesophilum]SDW75889.1 Protein N-acetyltransferase, RimJ/RimL family [Marininema mesophilum]
MNPSNIFRGARIRFTAVTEQAAEAYAKWSEDAEYLRNLDTDYAVPRSADSFRAEIQAGSGQGGGIEFAVHTVTDDKLIGFAALHSIEWNNQAGRLSIGIGEKDCRNKGYGTEALQLLLQYAFHELNLNRVGLDVIGSNRAAIRSYEKAGFIIEGVIREGVLRDHQKVDRIYMGILRREWDKDAMD